MSFKNVHYFSLLVLVSPRCKTLIQFISLAHFSFKKKKRLSIFSLVFALFIGADWHDGVLVLLIFDVGNDNGLHVMSGKLASHGLTYAACASGGNGHLALELLCLKMWSPSFCFVSVKWLISAKYWQPTLNKSCPYI